MLNTPVLFLIFNRPDLTEKVFAAIRESKPSKLFVAADGPRVSKNGESELCEQTRDVVLKNVDWDCEVHTLLREVNLGCKIAVSSAITWFFENIEAGIILEDDILPDPSFFTFCEEMLLKYKDDERVTTICGANVMGRTNISESYMFSKMFGVWGWASWRRNWSLYDGDIKAWQNESVKKEIKKWLGNKHWFDHIKGNLDMVFNKQFDTWDYQMVFNQLKQRSLSIIPAKNLIENIGFREDATHTKHSNSLVETQMKRHAIHFPIIHPENISGSEIYDRYFFGLFEKREHYILSLFKKIKRKVKNLIKRIGV